MSVNRAPTERFRADGEDVVTLGPWPKGIDNIRRDAELSVDAVRNAVNVDWDRDGHPSRRDGTILRSSGDAHSVFSDGEILLAVVAGVLTKFVVDVTTGVVTSFVIRAGFTSRPLAYTEVNGDIYYTDGVVTGKVVGGVSAPWGVPVPVSQPIVVSAASGGFAAGIYQVAVTHVSAFGEESGALSGVQVTIAAGQAISVSAIPQPAVGHTIRIYLTETNGGIFYLYNTYLVGTTGVTLTQSLTLGARLQTQFMTPPPPGQALEWYNGRIYIAQGSILWYTEAMRYGATHLLGFLPFPTEISIVARATTGLYVVADQHYFLDGADPAKMNSIVKLPFGAVYGTAVRLPHSRSPAADARASKLAATKEAGTVWMSVRGLVIADMRGDLRVISEDTIAVSENIRGASLVREQSEGIRQIVIASYGGVVSKLVSQDYIDAELIRQS